MLSRWGGGGGGGRAQEGEFDVTSLPVVDERHERYDNTTNNSLLS